MFTILFWLLAVWHKARGLRSVRWRTIYICPLPLWLLPLLLSVPCLEKPCSFYLWFVTSSFCGCRSVGCFANQLATVLMKGCKNVNKTLTRVLPVVGKGWPEEKNKNCPMSNEPQKIIFSFPWIQDSGCFLGKKQKTKHLTELLNRTI